MAIDLYDLTVPVLLRGLDRLSDLLEKGEAHARANGVPAEEMLGARLAPDMLTLAGSGAAGERHGEARGGADRRGGERSDARRGEELRRARGPDRADAGVPRGGAAGGDRRPGGRGRSRCGSVAASRRWPVQDYALQWVVPNFFFHVATAYGLLRMRGVPLGKKDYIGPMGA